jgi:hypothetical protein
MFKINNNKGFHLVLENGVTISTQFGGGNYCDNYNYPIGRNESGLECRDAEVAIWDKDDNWITSEVVEKAGIKGNGGDSVIGRLSIGDWLKLLDVARAL